jgi:predicted nicotinamide N-methyase
MSIDLEAGCQELHEGEPPPYWAFCWGSGQVLARWLLDHREVLAGRRVVDLGSGSGVAAIAAALAGAREVVAVDVDETARSATLANAHANGLGGALRQGAFVVSATLPDAWDLLVASDVLYEPGLAGLLECLRVQACTSGAALIVAEPERPGNPGHAAPMLLRLAARSLPDVDSPTLAARVHRLA